METVKIIKQVIVDLVVFFVLFFVTFWFVFKEQDPKEIIEVLNGANFWFILLGVGFMLLYFLTEAWNIWAILKTFKEKITFLKALKFTFVNFFFCSVSPGASGGQPMELYYMTREKISGAHATLAILIQTSGIQFAVMLLGTICMLTSPVEMSRIVWTLFVIGFIINGTALIVLMLSIFSNKTVRKMVRGGMKILRKLKVKKVDEWQEGIEHGLDDYAEGSKYIRAHKGQFAMSMGRSVLQIACYYLIPFCVYKSFGLSGHTIWELFAIQSIVFMSTSGLPIPGAIGASESVFFSLYGMVFGAELLSSATLLSRGVSFYIFVLVGFVVVFANIIWLRRKDGKA